MKGANFQRMLAAGELRVPPLEVRVVRTGRRPENAVLDLCWRDQSCRYIAELKRDAKPLSLKAAVEQAKRNSQPGGGLPMVIAPYLTSQKLDQLLSEGVSAVDFCGNAAVEAPGLFLVYRTGNPNRYPDSSPIRSAYRGNSSLVTRVLLLEQEFETIGDILAAIRKRGGSLVMGTVSKALQRLASDLVIERTGRNSVRVIQPGRILEGLLDAYQAPNVESEWTGKVTLTTDDLLARLQELAGEGDLVRTGSSSASEYALWGGEPIIECYCRATPTALLGGLGVEAKETIAFPNLRLIQTEDSRVYFDRRPRLAASPIQSWLEMASGDKRQKEVADQIRQLLLNRPGAN